MVVLKRGEQDERAPAEPESAAATGLPVLWHLKVSNYNEKARWALDYKRIPHIRRAAVAGRHREVARRVAGGSTLPVLVLDGQALGDSTEIIAALERRYPDPPLYPAHPGERQRALEFEEFFDEQLGPYARRLAVHHMLPDSKLFLGAFRPDERGLKLLASRIATPWLRPKLIAAFGIDDESVALAFDKLRAAGACFRAAVGRSGYLVGDSFTVADLTLAALIAPLVAPPQFPYPQPQREHWRLAPLRDALAESGLLDWTREIYARHRGESAALEG
jgi:glutathione S-transferase